MANSTVGLNTKGTVLWLRNNWDEKLEFRTGEDKPWELLDKSRGFHTRWVFRIANADAKLVIVTDPAGDYSAVQITESVRRVLVGGCVMTEAEIAAAASAYTANYDGVAREIMTRMAETARHRVGVTNNDIDNL